jgi:aspartate racemase
MVIESLNMRDTLAVRGILGDPQSWSGYDAIFRDALTRLEDAGCGVAAIASVTPHARLSEFIRDLALPVVSILETSAEVSVRNGLSSVVVLGTPVTMAGRWFEEALEAVGIDCPIRVSPSEIDEVQQLLQRYFYPGNGIEGREALLAFCKRMNPDPTGTAIILACTDFSAAFPEFATNAVISIEGITVVDAATAHIQAILNAAMPRV